ncbi:MAG: LytR C-terminal domain-containing protein [Nocardioides sp.]
MLRGVRSTLTLVTLVALLVGAAFWGWGAAMKPLPESQDLPLCEDTAVAAGQKVYPDQVTVSVFNASSRSGLAGRTSALLLDEGFPEGDSGNAPRGTTVAHSQIWTSDPQSPAVRLVESYLGEEATVVEGEQLGLGVVVVVGEEFGELTRGRKSAKARQAGFICSPPGST